LTIKFCKTERTTDRVKVFQKQRPCEVLQKRFKESEVLFSEQYVKTYCA
jgi:hypothetical protein